MLLRMKRTGKLFVFLRRHRHELFDDAFQEELEAMYRQTGAGKAPVSPGLMAMATILQGYLRASDAICWSAEAPRASRGGAPASPPGTPAGTSCALPGRAQERLRPAACRLHPEP
jgi:hypothetical protein